MSTKNNHQHGPMPVERASHLLNPLRSLILSPGSLAKRLDLKNNSIVLEVGPGPGYFSPKIARQIPQGKLVLVDVQQEMLNIARKRLEKAGITNAECVHGDIVSLSLSNESFDVAFLVAVLGEVSDQTRSLRELYRLLRPKGLLSITEQPGDGDFIPKIDLQAQVEREGFRLEKSYGHGKNYTINFRKS